MCSTSECNKSDGIGSIEPRVNLGAYCKKCITEKADVLLQKKHSYCRMCFSHMVTHKFRSTIGKNKLLVDDKVLALCTGNQSSITLLHLLRRGVDESSGKKIRFHPAVLFIDESVLWHKSTDVRSVLLELFNILHKFGFRCYVVKLSSVYELNEDYIITELQDINVKEYFFRNAKDEKLLSLFQEISSVTSKIDFLHELRNRILYETAHRLHYKNVFITECATNLSVRVLSDVALGRGAQIPCDVAVYDTKNGLVRCIRPLREITSKEIAFYNVFNGIGSSNVPSPTLMFDSDPSLQSETESFLYQLQENFPSTVYTVFRIGDKLKTTENIVERISCSLCCNYFVPVLNNSMHFQQRSSLIDVNHEKTIRKSDETEGNQIFLNVLCYGCQLITKDMESFRYLPNCLIPDANKESLLERTREQIQDFLL